MNPFQKFMLNMLFIFAILGVIIYLGATGKIKADTTTPPFQYEILHDTLVIKSNQKVIIMKGVDKIKIGNKTYYYSE